MGRNLHSIEYFYASLVAVSNISWAMNSIIKTDLQASTGRYLHGLKKNRVSSSKNTLLGRVSWTILYGYVGIEQPWLFG